MTDNEQWEEVAFPDVHKGDLIRYTEGELLIQGRVKWAGYSAWHHHKFAVDSDVALTEVGWPGTLLRATKEVVK